MFFLCHTGGLAYRFVDQEKYNNSELFVLLKDIINLLFNVYSFTNPLNTKPSTKQRHLSMPSIYRSPCVSGKLLP
uniref:Uncharacterized protein n=1 Tax=Caenorhabditis japonica TaxID=281687 RepID=A0A8R1EB25_CAEJA